MLLPWLVFPLTLAGLSYGCGNLVARTIAGRARLGALLLPVGFAVVVVVGSLMTMFGQTARLTTPVIVSIACAGIALSRRPRRLRSWAAAAAIAAFLAYGSPVLLSGTPTFAGYGKLDDTATFLAVTDRVMQHGRDLSGLAPSSYEATLSVNLAHGYPTGALIPLGVGSELVGSDPAWTFQPYLSFLAALLSLSLYTLCAGFVRSAGLRAVVAVVAAQPALLYGFSLWGGVKEMFAAALIAAVVACLSVAHRDIRVVVPAIVGAALLDGLSAGAVMWLVPLAAALPVVPRRSAGRALTGLGALSVLSLPALLAAPAFLRAANRSTFEDSQELGNLLHPLHGLQMIGVWPAADFRFEPHQLRATHVLVAVTAAAAAAGLFVAIKRRGWPVVAYAAACLTGAGLVVAGGSPWLDAKAYADASPAVVLLALGAAVSTVVAHRRVEGVLVLAAVAGGVVWSNVLAYRGVSLAPRDELVELETIGTRFAAQGPALMTEYQPYGVRHFLRRLDAEGASELRRRQIPLRSRRLLAKAEYADLGQFALGGVLVYRTLVLRRSPVESRPPLAYDRVWTGRFYEVWQRRPRTDVIADLPLGTESQPAGFAPCAAVMRLAETARVAGARLAAAPARRVLTPSPSGDVRVRRSSLYAAWVGGSFQQPLAFEIDSRLITIAQPRLEHAGSYVELGVFRLDAGVHTARLVPKTGDWRPGSGATLMPFYTLVLTPAMSPTAPVVVSAANAHRLCGKRFDWVEAVRGE